MSLDKAIKHNKERRKTYRERGKSGEYDITCRPNGGCPYCLSNRMNKHNRKQEHAEDLENDYFSPD